MKTNLLFLFAAVFVMVSCGTKEENEKLKNENEELEAELRRAKVGVETLEEIGSLMDSIDAAREAVQLELEAGTSYDDYVKRMERIQEYVANTESKISSLEKSFSEVTERNKAYISTIQRIKRQLQEKTEQIQELSGMVENYKSKNKELVTLVELQEAEINDKGEEIERKKEELELLENKLVELMRQAKVSEADSYFARAEAVEEAADRTKLAPKKKRKTYAEALDLYRKAYDLGREDAKDKIAELEEEI